MCDASRGARAAEQALHIHDVKLVFYSLAWVWSGKSLNGGDFYAG
jgi:hypothetical protein